ncbi:MAG TPA: phosphate ABC transporter ATP-binding protein PstB [Bdellovibrionota bacterium]|jgi:phosphate transport system ATP-binding protein|nr:phosphate ABC transporter ATP-binding protein PstB [Bdellovibrionota bacterium]
MGSIDVRSLNVSTKTKHILKDINIDIAHKQITAIVGPSGCGKSTFLRSLNRMHDLNPEFRVKGEVLLHEENILDTKYDVHTLRQKIGMVFQKPNPFPKSIYDNVAWGLKIHGFKNIEDRVQAALQNVALWEEVSTRLKDSALSLSGGQQQRLCIARALALEPEILLLDEPCSALDPISTKHIEDLLVKLSDQMSVVIVTHNLAQAHRISHKCAMFYEGQLMDYGPMSELVKPTSQPQTYKYLSGAIG